MIDLLKDKEFLELEKEYKFLSRARGAIESKHGNLDKLSYTVFDLETTGLDASKEEIIEIGALKVENGEVKSVFNKLVKADRKLSPMIVQLTGITDEMLENEPSIKPVLAEFLTFIGEDVLVAHNAEFDLSFIREYAKKLFAKDIPNLAACTLLISRDLLPNLENHKLHTVANYYHLNIVNRHRAIGDVELTYQIWLKFIEKLKEKNVLTRKDLEDYLLKLNGPGCEKPPF